MKTKQQLNKGFIYIVCQEGNAEKRDGLNGGTGK
jgi:hypothetical protein